MRSDRYALAARDGYPYRELPVLLPLRIGRVSFRRRVWYAVQALVRAWKEGKV